MSTHQPIYLLEDRKGVVVDAADTFNEIKTKQQFFYLTTREESYVIRNSAVTRLNGPQVHPTRLEEAGL